MGGLPPVDVIALAIVVLAALRGLTLGLLRESFSLASIGAACIAVSRYTDRVAQWLERESGGEIGALVAPWLAGGLLIAGGVAGSIIVGRLARSGARVAGLGWIDRVGGAVLGSGEGALIAGMLLALASGALGHDHPVLAKTRSMRALDELQQIAATGEIPLPDVAAPPKLRLRPSDSD